jgi:hypothetical protein
VVGERAGEAVLEGVVSRHQPVQAGGARRRPGRAGAGRRRLQLRDDRGGGVGAAGADQRLAVVGQERVE